MTLSSHQLTAFIELFKENSFSKAANKLNITQSALSQRIQKLEMILGSALLIRDLKGFILTPLGKRLLRYCQTKTLLEQEFLSLIKDNPKNGLSGVIRIASFSSITQSLLLKPLAELIRNNPDLHLELSVLELRELLPHLETGKVDFILSGIEYFKQGLHCELLGYEQNVLIKDKKGKSSGTVFLDHDMYDQITANFWKIQNYPLTSWKTLYLDNIYLILEAVRLGMGQAVVPRHLLKNEKELVILDQYKPLLTPVYLMYLEQAYYTKLPNQIIRLLKKCFN